MLDNGYSAVYIEFRTKQLKSCYFSEKARVRRWGRAVAHQYVARIDVLRIIDSLSDLRKFPSLSYHPLKGDRRGQHALRLTRRMRLIFSVEEEVTVDGAVKKCARIEEVSKHYGN